MFGLVSANLRRRTTRTALTAAGISFGVAAIVALLALSSGLTRSAGQLAHLGRADLGLFQKDAADPTSSVLPISLVARVSRQSEISAATPIQLIVSAVPRAPSAFVFGLQRRGFVAGMLVFTSGGWPAAGQVVVGDVLAGQLRLRLGDTIRISGRTLTIAGVYHTGTYQDQGVVTNLTTAQALAGRTPGEVTTIAVRLAARVAPAAATRSLQRTFTGVIAIADVREAARASVNGQLISKAVLLIVVLALIIGGLAVANTMLAAVLERRRELALLATIGWSGRQLGGLVLGEAVAVSAIGTAGGLLLGVLASGALPAALGLQAFITPAVTAWGLGRACLVGITIGVLGALVPIWRVTRMWTAAALAPG